MRSRCQKTCDQLIRSVTLIASLLAATTLPLFADEPYGILDVSCRLNGRPLLMHVDTGANYVFIFKSTAEREKLPVSEAPSDLTFEGRRYLGVVKGCALTWGEDVFQTDAFVVDTPPPRAPFDGVIGWLSIAGGVTEIDWDGKGIRHLKSLPRDLTGWETWPINAGDSYLSILTGGDSGSKGCVLIDTGAYGAINVRPEAWKKLTSISHSRTLGANYQGFPPAIKVNLQAWVQHLTMGPISIDGVIVEPSNRPTHEQYDAVLGLDALSRFNMVIDGPNHRIYVKPRGPYLYPIQYNRLGAVFVPEDVKADPLLAHVVEGSPAWRASIRPNDELLKIGDLDATKWRTDPRVLPLSRFWAQAAGTKLDLTLKRDGKPFQVNVTLEEIFPESVKYNPTPKEKGN